MTISMLISLKEQGKSLIKFIDKKNIKGRKSSQTLPIKCSEAGQPEETAVCKSGCSFSADRADI